MAAANILTNEILTPQTKFIAPKCDWYQNDSQVTLDIMTRNPKKCNIIYAANSLEINAILSDGTEYKQIFNLSKSIIPEKCSYKVMSAKIEIKLSKATSEYWNMLESNEVKATTQVPSRNWDKFAKEVDKEIQEEQSLNDMFQQIYSDGSDEVKKAMVKSYVESGGTELSTNWDNVKQGPVSCKPPEGLEWKKW